MSKITVSAPGKLMLFGEHAVVFGKPCIVTAVNQRLKLTAEKIAEPVLILNAPDVGIENYQKPLSDLGNGDIPKGAKFVEIAVRNFLQCHPELKKVSMTFESGSSKESNSSKAWKMPNQVRHDNIGISIKTTSEFKSTFGFGSSSASTVCTIYALAKIFEINLSQKEVFDICYKTVLEIQGVGSGFDLAAAIYGGTIFFKTGGEIIQPMNIDSLPLIVGYTGIKADTSTLVKMVNAKRNLNPKLVDHIIAQVENIVISAKTSLKEKNYRVLGELMNKNQKQFAKLSVSSQELDNLINAAINAGAYGAKLSGAGGGDCMIALSPPSKRNAVEKAIEKAGGQVLKVETNAKGVKIENT